MVKLAAFVVSLLAAAATGAFVGYAWALADARDVAPLRRP